MHQFNNLEHIVYALTIKDRPSKTDLWINKGFSKISKHRLVNYWKKRIETNSQDYFLATTLSEMYDKSHTQTTQSIDFKISTKQSKLINEVNNICYIVTTFNELELTKQCLRSIRKNDTGKIILINDGGDSTGLQELAIEVGATFLNSDHFKNIYMGARWWKRFFEAGLSSDCDYIVKLDPDSYFCRPLEYKISMDYFGTLNTPFFVHGGAQGFSKKVVEEILDLKILSLIGDNGNMEDGSFSTDRSINWVMGQLNIKAENWQEVRSIWDKAQKLKLKHPKQYAIIHPVSIGAPELV